MWAEFYYDETSPTSLRWAVNRWAGFNNSVLIAAVGDVAGSLGTRGWRVKLEGKSTQVHRVIYEIKVGKLSESEVIDPIDGNPFNNVIGNLRAVTGTINNRNKRKMGNNTSGATGVYPETINNNHYWIASYKDDSGKRPKRCFAVSKHGDDEAKRLAIAWRESAIAGLGYTERHGK